MEPIFKWVIQNISCKPQFTDKFGNLRTDAIKTVNLLYVGVLGDIEHSAPLAATLSLINLSDFTPISELSNEQIIAMALAAKHPEEIEQVENSVKNKFLQS